jgi:hypothetical protein
MLTLTMRLPNVSVLCTANLHPLIKSRSARQRKRPPIAPISRPSSIKDRPNLDFPPPSSFPPTSLIPYLVCLLTCFPYLTSSTWLLTFTTLTLPPLLSLNRSAPPLPRCETRPSAGGCSSTPQSSKRFPPSATPGSRPPCLSCTCANVPGTIGARSSRVPQRPPRPNAVGSCCWTSRER